LFTFLFQILFELIDAYWLDQLGWAGVFASIGAASFVTWSLYALMLLVTGGVNSLTANARGRGDIRAFKIIAWEGFFLALIFSFLITLVFELIHVKIFTLIGLEGKILSQACLYFKIMNRGFLVMFLFSLTGVIFNSHGNTSITMNTGLFAFALNALLDPLLIKGGFGITGMGIKGAALATLISQLAGFSARWSIMFKKGYIGGIIELKQALLFKNSRKILEIGIPQASTHWVFSMVYPVLSYFITLTHNIHALGALSICHRLEGFPYFAAISLGIAATTLTGQYYGAGNIKTALAAAHRTVAFSSAVMAFFSILFIFFPEKILSMITSSPEIITQGAVYLRIIGYLEVFMALEIGYEGAFVGFGLTSYTMLISVPFTLCRIPLAWYLAFTCNMGVTGIWWAISITTCVKGIGIFIIFMSGFWKKKLIQ
jgi:putative MATE family efflux protein